MNSIIKQCCVWALAVLFSLASVAGYARTTAKESAADAKPTILYSQMASSATLAAAEEPGWYTLTLKGVNRNILWFTDRPVRKSGTVTNEDFLKDWNAADSDSFAKDNPNGSLVASLSEEDAAQEQVFVMRLSQPSYDAESKTMQYRVQLASEDDQSLLNHQVVYNVALFVDGFTMSNGLGHL